MTAILACDVAVEFHGYMVHAPKGTRLELVKGASGGRGDMYAIPPHACDAGVMGKAGTWSIFGHDSKYHYIWASIDAIELVE